MEPLNIFQICDAAIQADVDAVQPETFKISRKQRPTSVTCREFITIGQM